MTHTVRLERPKTVESEFFARKMDVLIPHFLVGGGIDFHRSFMPPLTNNTAKSSFGVNLVKIQTWQVAKFRALAVTLSQTLELNIKAAISPCDAVDPTTITNAWSVAQLAYLFVVRRSIGKRRLKH